MFSNIKEFLNKIGDLMKFGDFAFVIFIIVAVIGIIVIKVDDHFDIIKNDHPIIEVVEDIKDDHPIIEIIGDVIEDIVDDIFEDDDNIIEEDRRPNRLWDLNQ